MKNYSYDLAGSITAVSNSATGVTTALSYDGESRMTSAGNGVFADTYRYNGLDQRTGKVDAGGTFSYTRQDDAIDSSVLSDGAAVYNHGAGAVLVSEVRGGTSKFYHADGHGSTGALTSSTGATTDILTTDAFGMTVTSSGTTPTPFGYAGQGGYQSDADVKPRLKLVLPHFW